VDQQFALAGHPVAVAGQEPLPPAGREQRLVANLPAERYPGVDFIDVLAARPTAPRITRHQFCGRDRQADCLPPGLPCVLICSWDWKVKVTPKMNAMKMQRSASPGILAAVHRATIVAGCLHSDRRLPRGYFTGCAEQAPPRAHSAPTATPRIVGRPPPPRPLPYRRTRRPTTDPRRRAGLAGFLGPSGDGKSTETGNPNRLVRGLVARRLVAACGYQLWNRGGRRGRYFQHERVGDVERLRASMPNRPTAVARRSAGLATPTCTDTTTARAIHRRGLATRWSLWRHGSVDLSRSVNDWQVKWTVDTNASSTESSKTFSASAARRLIHDDLVIVMVGGSPRRGCFASARPTRPRHAQRLGAGGI
jgi:hypothetical protein